MRYVVKILICGAGAIGIYLGATLHAQGHEVELFGRKKLKEAKNEIRINGKLSKMPKKIFDLPNDKHYDTIFVTAKLYDLEKMLLKIKKNNLTTGALVSIQNGLVDNSKYNKILGNQRLAIMSVFEGFRLSDQDLVMTQTKMGWKTEYSKEGIELSKLLTDAGIMCKPDKNLDNLRAEKTIVNCSLNALSAIHHATFDKLFSNEKTRKAIDALFYECYNILKQDFNLESAEIIKTRMYATWSKMNHYSSTCQDIQSGRPTEIDFLNKYIITLGKKYNLPTSENEKIVKEFTDLMLKN